MTAQPSRSTSSEPAAPEAAGEGITTQQAVLATIVISVALFSLVGLIFGGVITRIFIAIVLLATAHGFWRGLIETASFVVGLLLAVVLAMPLRRLLEAPVGAIAGIAGVTNRVVSVGVGGLLVVIVVTVALQFAGRPYLKRRPGLKRWNRALGAGLGLLEGSLLALAVVWTPLALEPIAAQQLAPPPAGMEARKPNPVAERVVWLAEKSRESFIGQATEVFNPLPSTELLQLSGDFVIVSRDEEAMEHFLDSEAVQAIRDNPSVRRAMEILRSDERIARMLESEGVSANTIVRILNSKASLRMLDETDVVDEIGPMIGDIRAVLAEAKEIAEAPKEEGPNPMRLR